MEVGYRTERFSGLMERDAVDVMTFETHDLMNTDIPETLCAGVLMRSKENCSVRRKAMRPMHGTPQQ